MTLLVNAALGALAGVVGSLAGHFVLGGNFGLPVGVLAALAGYVLGQSLQQQPGGAKTKVSRNSAPIEWEDDDSAKKQQKKQKKAEAEKKKREEAAAEKEREAAEKKQAKKSAEKAKKSSKKVESEDESEPEVVEPVEEEEEESSSAPKSKSALKKAKAKAKELAAKKEAEAAAKAAADAAKAAAKKNKKNEKKGAAAAEPAPVAASAKVDSAAETKASKAAAAKAAAAAAAAAADLEGWETIEATKPTKSQQAKAAAASSAPAPSGKKGKTESVPASERPLTDEFIVSVKHHALIIGPGGATLKKLTEGSGAEIDMPKRDSGSAKIQITGTPAQVAAAKNAIQSLVDRGFSSITDPGILSDDITVESTHIGLILGPNASTLKQIQTKTSTKINLPEKNSASKKVTIVGEKENVRAAKAALRSLIQDGFSTLTHEGWIKSEIDFPMEKFGVLVGPKGQTIKSIQGNTKTRINLPDKSSKSSTISVVGLPAGVAQAEKEIAKLLEPLAPLPDPEEEDLATDEAWGQEHTAQGEDALWA